MYSTGWLGSQKNPQNFRKKWKSSLLCWDIEWRLSSTHLRGWVNKINTTVENVLLWDVGEVPYWNTAVETPVFKMSDYCNLRSTWAGYKTNIDNRWFCTLSCFYAYLHVFTNMFYCWSRLICLLVSNQVWSVVAFQRCAASVEREFKQLLCAYVCLCLHVPVFVWICVCVCVLGVGWADGGVNKGSQQDLLYWREMLTSPSQLAFGWGDCGQSSSGDPGIAEVTITHTHTNTHTHTHKVSIWETT